MRSKWAKIGFCCWLSGMGASYADDFPAPPLEKQGWRLTFHDEFDRPQLNDLYWYPAYRSGRKEYFKRIGVKSRWTDHNACTVIADGALKLRIDEKLPFRANKTDPCVSCVTTSDHRFGATTDEVQILDKFAQKYGWFEIRAKCAKGEGLLNAFWLHQHDPNKQEYTPDGKRKSFEAGSVEIDIIEQQGRHIGKTVSKVDLNIHFTKDGHYLYPAPIDASAGFHVWALEWQEGQLNWYLDGKVIKTYKGSTPQEKMFILLALFQYSGWIGTIDPNLTYPRDFEIDYVRVYEKNTP